MRKAALARLRHSDRMEDQVKSDADDRPQVLLVEDDDAVRRSLQLLLHWNGYRVRAFSSAAAAIADPDMPQARVLVADFRLHDGDGLGVLRALRRLGWQGRSILITGHLSQTLIDAAYAGGFDTVLEKPLHQQQLISALA